jgi:hypothetical protein
MFIFLGILIGIFIEKTFPVADTIASRTRQCLVRPKNDGNEVQEVNEDEVHEINENNSDFQ